MITKEDILQALSAIPYPGGENIVSEGMVETAESTAEGIRITLRAKRHKDPAMSSIKHACVQALKEKFGPDTVVGNN